MFGDAYGSYGSSATAYMLIYKLYNPDEIENPIQVEDELIKTLIFSLNNDESELVRISA